MAQRIRRIDARGASGRDSHRDQCHQCQSECDRGENEWIGGADLIQQTAQQASQRERAGNSREETDHNGARTLAQYQREQSRTVVD